MATKQCSFGALRDSPKIATRDYLAAQTQILLDWRPPCSDELPLLAKLFEEHHRQEASLVGREAAKPVHGPQFVVHC